MKEKGVVDDDHSNEMLTNATITPLLCVKSKVVITQIKENVNQAAMHPAPTTQTMMHNPTMNNQYFAEDYNVMYFKDENIQNG